MISFSSVQQIQRVDDSYIDVRLGIRGRMWWKDKKLGGSGH